MTLQEFKNLKPNLQYLIVPKQKRTIHVHLCHGKERFLINFPTSLFIKKRNFGFGAEYRYCTFAIDNNDNICHLPLYNIANNGLVCLPKYGTTMNEFKDIFFNTGYSICFDQFAQSIGKYLMNNKSILANLTRIAFPNTNDLVRSLYQNLDQFKLISTPNLTIERLLADV